MAESIFVGREKEMQELRHIINKRSASLVVVKGRRRIGKSRLIEEFAKNYKFYEFAGLPPTSHTTKQSQLDDFASQLSLVTGMPGIKADDWNTLFLMLASCTKRNRVIILLDEISWMGFKDPDFLGKLKNAWDKYFKKNPQLLLVICGSASAWIDKNILSSTAFMGRVSYTLTLDELPLSDCRSFWSGVGSKFANYDIFKYLSVTGGIPRYLEELQPHYSAEENIRRICFKRGGILTHEFKDIFSDLFGNRNEKYSQITRLLIDGSLEYKEICKKLGVGSSGLISEYLNDLIASGFISRDNVWDLKSGVSSPLLFRYRLKDNYIRFYLKYIESRLPEIERNMYEFISLNSLPGWSTIMGLQFENLVLNNRLFIHRCLNLSPNDIVNENPYFQHKGSRQQGCQIDYMIQTKTNVLYACEVKFSRNELNKSVILDVQDKVKRLATSKGMSICPVLIHVNGVNDSIIDAAYFAHIIDFGDILR